MLTACDTLLQLHRQCSGLRPTPSLFVGLQPDVAAHVKSSVVLRLVEERLTPLLRECVQERLISEADLLNRTSSTVLFDTARATENSTVSRRPQVVSIADPRAAIPVFRMLSQTIRSCSEVHRDGGWTLAYLLGKGIRHLTWIAEEPGFGVSRVYHGIRAVEQWVAPVLRDDVIPLLLSLGMLRRLTTRVELIEYCKASARLTGWVSPSVERKWLEALIDGIHLCADATGGKLFPNRLRIGTTRPSATPRLNRCDGASSGANSFDSQPPPPAVQVLRGIILDWQLPLEAQLLFQRCGSDHLENITCIAFREAITDSHCGTLMACLRRLRAYLSSGVTTLASQKELRLIACQKTMSTLVRYELFQAGVVALERLSIRFVDAFAAVCGCVVMSGVEDLCLRLDAADMPSSEEPPAVAALHQVVGQLDALRSAEDSVGGRYRMTLLGCEGICSVHTMLFSVTEDAAHMESFLEEQLTSTFQSLCHLFSQGALVVCGAGLFERFLADYIAAWMVLHEGRDDVRQARAVANAVCRVLSSLHEDHYAVQGNSAAFRSLDTTPTANSDSQAISRAAMIAVAYVSRRPRRGCASPGEQSENWGCLGPLRLEEMATSPSTPQCHLTDPSATPWDSWWAKRAVMSSAWETWSTMVLIDECRLEQPL